MTVHGLVMIMGWHAGYGYASISAKFAFAQVSRNTAVLVRDIYFILRISCAGLLVAFYLGGT